MPGFLLRRSAAVLGFSALLVGGAQGQCEVEPLLDLPSGKVILIRDIDVATPGAAFTIAQDNDVNFETLYRSDGTFAGTGAVPLPDPRMRFRSEHWVSMGSELFFPYEAPDTGVEIWRASANGEAVLLDDIASLEGDEAPGFSLGNGYLGGLTTDGERIYYVGRKPGGNDRHLHTLYVSDGEVGSASILQPDISDADVGPINHILPSVMGALSGAVYLISGSATSQTEPTLWKWEGGQGTAVRSMPTFASGYFAGESVLFIRLSSGAELWRTDGTSAGTYRLTPEGQMFPGVNETVSYAVVGNTMYYVVGGQGWIANGGPDSGRVIISSGIGTATSVEGYGDTALFRVTPPQGPAQLWISKPGVLETPVRLEEYFGVEEGSLAPGIGLNTAVPTWDEFYLLSASNRIWRTDFSPSPPQLVCDGSVGTPAGWAFVNGVIVGNRHFPPDSQRNLALFRMELPPGPATPTPTPTLTPTPTPAPTLGPFSVLSPGGLETVTDRVEFVWTASANAVRYEVLAGREREGSNDQFVFRVDEATTSFSPFFLPDTVDPDLPYLWFAIAYDDFGSSRGSDNLLLFFNESPLTAPLRRTLGFPVTPSDTVTDTNNDGWTDSADVMFRFLGLEHIPGP